MKKILLIATIVLLALAGCGISNYDCIKNCREEIDRDKQKTIVSVPGGQVPTGKTPVEATCTWCIGTGLFLTGTTSITCPYCNGKGTVIVYLP